MILVTGAAGKTGRSIVRHLARRGAPVRAFIHRPEHEVEVVAAGAREVAVGDLTLAGSLGKAVAGVRVVYHICPNLRPDEIEIGRRVIDACREARVERLVYHSVLHPQIAAMPHHWAKLRVEELLLESGVDFTILQPAAYMQNLLPLWEAMRERGVLRVPYAAETRLGMVDLEDVAAVAAEVVTEEGHGGAIYELAGSEVMTQAEVAAVAGEALGRKVRVEVVSRSDWTENARSAGLGDYAVSALRAMFRHYERHGFWGNSRVLAGLLGREPTRLRTFCERCVGKEEG